MGSSNAVLIGTVDDFEKGHKKVVADVSHSVFEEMGGQDGKTRGRRDVLPKNYFPHNHETS